MGMILNFNYVKVLAVRPSRELSPHVVLDTISETAAPPSGTSPHRVRDVTVLKKNIWFHFFNLLIAKQPL